MNLLLVAIAHASLQSWRETPQRLVGACACVAVAPSALHVIGP